MKAASPLLVALASAGVCCFPARAVSACTTFLASHAGQPVFGKNYDWNTGAGLVTINPRGLQKSALTTSSAEMPATWTAQFGSITFNQYGAEMPNGGLNEQGLAIEIMWLASTQYPPADSRPVVNELQWIQRALDLFATVDELALDAPKLRVSKVYGNVHYLACDARADCASFEYIDGQLVVTRGSSMPAKTLANDTYADSAHYLATFAGFGGSEDMPWSTSSLDRFARASILARTTDGTTVPDSAFTILESVADWSTVWSIVYVPTTGIAYFRTAAVPKVKSASLAGFSLACGTRRVLDIDADASGDVGASFADYSQAANRRLLARSMANMDLQRLPAGFVDLLVAYPDSIHCGTDAGSSQDSGTDGTPTADGGTTTQSSGGCSCSVGSHDRRSNEYLAGALLALEMAVRRAWRRSRAKGTPA
jgi:choloylglycine hydrolase